MSRSNLKNWPILSFLEPIFIDKLKMVMVYGDLGNEVLMVTEDDSVYALGNNKSGCLGTGDILSTFYPKKIDILSQKGVQAFAYGAGCHVLALTDKGEVYSWGNNEYGQLGNGSFYQNLIPAKIETTISDKIVIQIACGSHHSLALTDTGEIYAWGQSVIDEGYIDYDTVQIPCTVNWCLAGKKVINIACDQSSSVAVTSCGEVYSWSNRRVDDVPILESVDYPSLNKVTGLSGIVIAKVVCGYAHTLALSNEGELYVWGENGYGQLGFAGTVNSGVATKLISEMRRVLDIAALPQHHISVAMAHGGSVYIWGQCLGQSVYTPMATPFSNMHEAFAAYTTPSTMYAPLILHSKEETSIVDFLKQAFDDPSTSDLTIQVQGKPIHVHKAVLKIRCQYFRSMFHETWVENNRPVIEHDEFSYEVYRSFLKYLYTDEIDLPLEEALELMNLANAYLEPQLKRCCVQIIKRGVTQLNVAFLYSAAIQYKSQELEDFCFTFAIHHLTAVTQTPNFAKLDEETLKTFIVKAAQAGAFKM